MEDTEKPEYEDEIESDLDTDFSEHDDFDDSDELSDEQEEEEQENADRQPLRLRRGMDKSVMRQEHQYRMRLKQRRSGIPTEIAQTSYQARHQETLLALALEGQDDRFKAKVYELVIDLNLEPDDPLFLMLIATGRLETLLEERPQELSALFDQWEDRVYTKLENYRSGLETYERTAVKAQEKAIAQSVHDLIQRTTFEKFVHSFTVASVGLAIAFTLIAAGVGGALGYGFREFQARAVRYAPLEPRRLTLAEAQALEWSTSREGQRARQLWEWNRDLLANYACEQQAENLGVTLSLQGQLAERGACVLWVRPVSERRLRSSN
ncbi:hypothetical protein H6G20_06150 [Desertifilum sp. FACHB-1129]|nr:hypothetical protein [Desertifilum sp. FACHB-1129]MBD2324316.1 hypothetical protein [Desertifilum sp. FACHB-866]MBD2334330.1 hypothetical protein [Desertifilum sp. FACHB-868]